MSPEWDDWDGIQTSGADALVQSVVDTTGGNAPAWQITNGVPGGFSPHYSYALYGNPLTNARAEGWRMTANARLVTASPTAAAMGFSVYVDKVAYTLQLNKQSGQLYAYLWDTQTSPFALTRLLAGDANGYHDYEFKWSPDTGLASFYFDGQFILEWDGVPSTHTALENRFLFGTTTDGGSGVMNFRSVLFETLDTSPASQGDYNGDGRVDAADYAVWRNNRGTRTGVGDGNGDGFVGQPDYTVWRQNYGRALTAPLSPASPAPEPGRGLLVSMAVLSAALAVRPVP